MTARASERGSAGGQPSGPLAWSSTVLRLVGVPAMAWLWWALAFLPWTQGGKPDTLSTWPPSLPAVLTDLGIAVFGPLGAGVVVVALLRRGDLAFLSVLLGFGFSAVVTLSRGADTHGIVVTSAERYVMLAVCAFAAFGGLAVGVVATGSLRAFGFLGLLAVEEVASLVEVVLNRSGANPDHRWLTCAVLVVLLVMIMWRPGLRIALWPVFFVLFWVLDLVRSAFGYGAANLFGAGSSEATVWRVLDAALDFVRAQWLTVLATSWSTFWPAAVIVALLVAGRYGWGRLRPVDAGERGPEGASGPRF